MKRLFFLLSLLLAMALALSACAPEAAPEAPELLEPVGVSVDTAVCKYSEIYNVLYYDSAVVPYVEGLSLEIDGTVDEMLVIPGQKVKAGDPLLTLNLESVEKQAESLESTLEYTRQVYAFQNEQARLNIEMLNLTLSRLQTASPVDEAAVQSCRTSIADAELSLQQAQETQALELSILENQLADLNRQLGQTTLYAPFDGTVVHCARLTEGSYLPARTIAVHLADDSRLYLSGEYATIDPNAPNTRLYALISGEKYDITMVEKDYSDTIADIWAGFSPTTDFTIDGPEDKLDHIQAGDYAAIMYLYQYQENVLVVPTNAIFRDSGVNYVYVIGENGTRTRTNVTIGTQNDSITQIREGLQEGDVVYVQN